MANTQRRQMSDAFATAIFIILSGGLQDAYRYCCRGGVFANAQTGNIVMFSIHLTQMEFKIISLLAQNSGRVMTYDTIISNIWGPYADDDNSILRVNMAHIRRKLEQNPAEPQYVFTEIGIGYRMIEDEMQ